MVPAEAIPTLVLAAAAANGVGVGVADADASAPTVDIGVAAAAAGEAEASSAAELPSARAAVTPPRRRALFLALRSRGDSFSASRQSCKTQHKKPKQLRRAVTYMHTICTADCGRHLLWKSEAKNICRRICPA